MSRGGIIPKPPREPDARYKSKVIAKFINMVMESGKKSLAKRIVYEAIHALNPEDIKEAKRYFEEAVKNLMPEVEVRSRRVGGANYQIPVPVRFDRSETLALRWLIDTCKSRSGSPFADRLSEEIKLVYKNEGSAMKKKADTHRMAEANRAFGHFRW